MLFMRTRRKVSSTVSLFVILCRRCMLSAYCTIYDVYNARVLSRDKREQPTNLTETRRVELKCIKTRPSDSTELDDSIA
jgi:hypothetical protein